MKRVVTLVGMMGLLGGCATSPTQSPWLINRAEPIPLACAPLSQEQELTLNLAQKTADEGRLHAALANLERLPSGLPQARLSKARILRSLNRPEAGELYSGLLNTCLKAQGEHGLGQLASAAGRQEEALQRLRLAASLDPTSDTIRNDLGVVYMNLGRLDEARFELLTAIELNESEKQPALNLLTLLIHQGNGPQASALADRLMLSPSQFRIAEERARALRDGQAAATDAVPRIAKATKPLTAPAVPGKAVVAYTPLVKPIGPATNSAVKPAAPSPQLSNFRPTPVVSPAVAAASAGRPVAPAAVVAGKPITTAAAPAVASTPAPAAPVVAKTAVAAVPVVASAPAVARVPAPVAAPKPAVAAPAVAASTPAVSRAPVPVATPVAPKPAAAVAATVARAPAPAAAPVTTKPAAVAASVVTSAPVVARAPAPVAAPTATKPAAVAAPAVASAPAVARAPVAPVAPVVAKPTVAVAPQVATAAVAKPVVAAAPVSKPVAPVAAAPVVRPAAPAASVASTPRAPAPAAAAIPSPTVAAAAVAKTVTPARPTIEMRPGRLIVADDGSVRVEPIKGN